jgi:hypothetical protein
VRIAPVIAWGGLLALVLLVSFSEFARALLLGWLFFLWRVLPQIKVNWGTAAVALTALILFSAGIHWIGSSWYRRTYRGEITPRPKWRLRWSLTIVAGVFLLFAAGISLIGVVHQTSWLATSPEPIYASAFKTRTDSSKTNLKMIGLAIHNHQDAYNCLPSRWAFAPTEHCCIAGKPESYRSFLTPPMLTLNGHGTTRRIKRRSEPLFRSSSIQIYEPRISWIPRVTD